MDEYVCYKSKIRLVDIATEASLPTMRIRKIGKFGTVYKPVDKENEPVSDLHIVAFERTDNDGNDHYLSAVGDDIRWATVSVLTCSVAEPYYNVFLR